MSREPSVPHPATTHSSAPLDGMLDSVPDAIVIVDSAFAVTYANPAAATLLATTPEYLLGRSIEGLFSASSWIDFVRRCTEYATETFEDVSVALRKTLSYRISPGTDGYVIWMWDVTDRQLGGSAADNPAAGSSTAGGSTAEWTGELAQSMLDAVPAGTVVLDPSGTIVLANRTWNHFWATIPGGEDYSAGANYLELCTYSAEHGNEHAAAVLAGILTVTSGEEQQFTYNYGWSTSSAEHWYRLRATRLADGAGLYLTHTDITEQVTSAERAPRQDQLTGLPNRERIEALLLGELAERAPDHEVSVLLVDIDGFKEFNDVLGPARGDELLQLVAARLGESTRPTDTLGRLTGDEFVVIARGCQSVAARALAAGFASVLEPAFELDGQQLTITASVGVATSNAGTTDPVQLVHDATTAMHAAKAHGRSSHQVFSTDLRDSNRKRLEIVERLRGVAMAEHELEMLYQPIVDLASGSVVGAEALIRWNHPERGLLTPDSFIPLAEDADLIIPLSNWILGEVGRTIAGWQRRDINVQVGVNVSPLHFAAGTLATDVVAVMESFDIEPGRLVLELAESKSLHDVDAVHYQLMDVRRHGALIAIDDFGSGFSSLERLATLPVDILKIDKSLTQHLDSRNLQRRRAMSALCKAVVEVTHDLGKDTVVEGIETTDQLDSCVEMAVTFGQGHLLGRPMTATQLEQILLQNGAHSASA
ncbi:putative bifunctional diguanylate cyclase/phosphodiesterase [Rhodococcoides yunnanense]|uniref:putative bifunctional diguanylate cyclase/phosphodiesterase n=1 Tax=Rhodococcoides yunnanense TaxID=278209 RepID=UPI000932A4C8|nr:EAL domain-containing protein [Rhodococcus yunnanensis]